MVPMWMDLFNRDLQYSWIVDWMRLTVWIQVGFVKRCRILSPGGCTTTTGDWITRISVTFKEVHPGGVSGPSKSKKFRAFEWDHNIWEQKHQCFFKSTYLGNKWTFFSGRYRVVLRLICTLQKCAGWTCYRIFLHYIF